jgi:hypothetical protein
MLAHNVLIQSAQNASRLSLRFLAVVPKYLYFAWDSWLILWRSPVSILASKPSVLIEGFSNFLQSPPAVLEVVPQIRPRHVLSASFLILSPNGLAKR